jgi:hypothetical protein
MRFRRKNVKQLSPVSLRDNKLEWCVLKSWRQRSQGNCIISHHFLSFPVPAEGFEPLTLGLWVVYLTTDHRTTTTHQIWLLLLEFSPKSTLQTTLV